MATAKTKPGAGVDWKKLRHAQGPATSVPKQIAALTHAETDARDEAFFALNDTLYAENAWFSASEPAVEALLSVAFTRAEGSHRALWLSADVISGNHEAMLAHVAARTSIAAPAFIEPLAAKYQSNLLELLKAQDGRQRSAVAVLLACLPTLAPTTIAALIAAIQAESETEVRASFFLALSVLSVQTGSTQGSAALESAREPSASLGRGARALALLLTSAPPSPDMVTDAAAGLLEAELDTERFYWGHARGKLGAVERLLSIVARGRGIQTELSDALLAIVGSATAAPRVVEQAAAIVLNLSGFKEKWPKETDVAAVSELSESQQRVARAFATREGIKLGWGLPPAARDRQRWLGLAAPGPLDKLVHVSVEGKVVPTPLWRAWRGYSDKGRVVLPPELHEQLSVRERFEAMLEAALGGYAVVRARPGMIRAVDVLTELGNAGAEALGWADWAVAFADEAARVFSDAALVTERGGAIVYPGSVPLLLVIVRAGRSIESKWDNLLTWTTVPENREVLAAVPPERREAAIWGQLGPYTSPDIDTGVDQIMPILDLVPSQRITEVLLTKLRNLRARMPLHAAAADAHLARIAELAKTEPGIRAALEAAPAAG